VQTRTDASGATMIAKVSGDKLHPTNAGRLCTKGATHLDLMRTPGRMETAYLRPARDLAPVAVSVDAAVRELIRREGRIDLLVNNAGFGVAPAAAEESSIEQAKAIFDTNFFGLIRMTRAVVPHMRRQGSGRIINIGSVLGFLPMPYGALYAASKHAVEGYSESLDHELRTRGIRVSVIEPAYTKTQFDANLMAADAKIDEYREVRMLQGAVLKQVMAKGDEPAVVAEVVLKAATAARPNLRYTAGGLANRLRLLRRFAPAGLVDAGLRKDLRLDAQSRAATRSAT